MVYVDFVINFIFMKIVKHNLILHNIQEKIVMENVENQLILLINHECRQMKRDNRKIKRSLFLFRTKYM